MVFVLGNKLPTYYTIGIYTIKNKNRKCTDEIKATHVNLLSECRFMENSRLAVKIVGENLYNPNFYLQITFCYSSENVYLHICGDFILSQLH